MGLPCFLGEVPDYSCDESGRVYITIGDFQMVMPQHIFLAGCALGHAAVVAWQKKERAKNGRVFAIKAIKGH